jgi:hypothetical protein
MMKRWIQVGFAMQIKSAPMWDLMVGQGGKEVIP